MSVLYGTSPRPADGAGGSGSGRVSPQVTVSQTPQVTRESIQEQIAALRGKLVLKENVAQNREAEEQRLLAEFVERLAKIRNAQKSVDSIRAEIGRYEAALAAMSAPRPVVPPLAGQPSVPPAPAAPRKKKTLDERISELESTLKYNEDQLKNRQQDQQALGAKVASGATLTKKEADKLANAQRQIPTYEERVKTNRADLAKLRGGE